MAIRFERKIGTDHPLSKLTWEIVEEIRSQHEKGCKQKDLAKKYKVSPSAIGKVIRRESWVS